MPATTATCEPGGTNLPINSPARQPFSLGSTHTMQERRLSGASVDTQTTRIPLSSASSIRGLSPLGFPAVRTIPLTLIQDSAPQLVVEEVNLPGHADSDRCAGPRCR